MFYFNNSPAKVGDALIGSQPRRVTLRVIGSPYVLSSGYLNAKDLFQTVLSNAGWQVIDITGTVGWFSSEYLITIWVDQVSDQDLVDQMFVLLSAYMSDPQISIIAGAVTYVNPYNPPSGITTSPTPTGSVTNTQSSTGLNNVVKSIGLGLGMSAGTSVALILGSVIIGGVILSRR